MINEKVLIAMSGGVDSAVAALLLKQYGYSLAGITMRLWSEERKISDSDDPTEADQNCVDAKLIADALQIPHYCVSYGDTFRKEVIDKFIAEYEMGKTPNPCVFCNKHIKFGCLLDKMSALGFDKFATGHYARIEKSESGIFLLKKAKDEQKDQSYFLWSLSKDILSQILFPLGNFTKQEIREIAKDNNFSNAHRADSQDICFIPNGDYVSFIISNSNPSIIPGKFVDVNGNTIGEHNGLLRYTVGQRKGLGIAFGKPMFVGAKNPIDNTVMLCEDRELYSTKLTAVNCNLIACGSLSSPIRAEAKIRYRHKPAKATVEQISNDKLQVIFDEPQRAIAPGQSLVLYDGDTVVGGGIIE